MNKDIKMPTRAEQQLLEQEAKEIKNSILEKRISQVRITSSNTQRLFVDEMPAIIFYFFGTCLLLLIKLSKPNQASTLYIIYGFCLTLIITFFYGLYIITLQGKKQKISVASGKKFTMLWLFLFIPYLFGLYLIFVAGIYDLLKLFSLIYIPQAVGYAFLGYSLIRKVKIIHELGIRIISQ